MKLLITGSTGFLGRRAAAHFSVLGHQVLTPSRTELDITDPENITRWFLTNQPEAVIHCAAVSDTGLCQKNPEWSHAINVDGSVHLADACSKYGAKFVFCSSDQVYHASSLPGPHCESESLRPETVYARQKFLAEQLCQEHCPNTVSLRLSWMYSTQFLAGEHGHLLTTLRDLLVSGKDPIVRSVHDFRGITDVDHVVQNLPATLHLPAGVYNFGAENDLDIYHTLKTAFEILELQNGLDRLIPDDSLAPRDIRMDGTKAASHGICFGSTVAGLCRALSTIL